MTNDRLAEDRIARWLEDELPTRVPDRVLDAAFERTRSIRQERRPWLGLQFGGGTRTWVLVATGALLVVLLGIVLAPGALRLLPEATPRADRLAQIRQLGRIAFAVRPDHPQFEIGGQAAVGFDTDVADALGLRLGLRAEVTIIDVATMLSGARGKWDAALPSIATWDLDSAVFQSSSAYYYWPHRLVVRVDEPDLTPADLQSGPICAVTGDAGEGWLRGRYGDADGTPITDSIVTRPTDADCLALLQSGGVIAAITAHLSDADLQVRSDIRVIGGPGPEPRSVIVFRGDAPGPDSTGLLRAIDEALAAMRADGTLRQLSERRFGGADLTQP